MAGNGKWGQADLTGNVMEWVQDSLTDPYMIPCDNCAALGGSYRIYRGGSFNFGASIRVGTIRQLPVDAR
jgi:formylglycine-generating enzyme required for sulfatase activity